MQAGIEQFHFDSNEVTNDIAVPPSQNNVCFGVWERAGRRTFRLTHLAVNFDSNNQYTGLFKLAATLTVSKDGQSFTGTYESDQEDLAGNNIPDFMPAGP